MRKRLATIALVVALTTVTSSCGDGTEPAPGAPSVVNGMSMAPELRPDTGEVVLPIDRLTLSFLEMDLLAHAAAFKMSECLAERGVTFNPRGPQTDAIYFSEQYFGPWTHDQAERFGFVPPMSDADLTANHIAGAPLAPDSSSAEEGSTIGEESQELADGCAETPPVQEFITPQITDGELMAPFAETQGRVFGIDEGRQALDDLEECYAAEGLDPAREEPWLPDAADSRSLDPEQLDLAGLSVDCKDETDFTQRIATVEAALQAEIIAQHADELFEKREEIDAALAAARSLFEAEGIPFLA